MRGPGHEASARLASRGTPLRAGPTVSHYPRRYIEGDGDRPLRVYVVRETPVRTVYGMRQSLVPIGIEFTSTSDGWCAVELLVWEQLPPNLRAGELPEGGGA